MCVCVVIICLKYFLTFLALCLVLYRDVVLPVIGIYDIDILWCVIAVCYYSVVLPVIDYHFNIVLHDIDIVLLQCGVWSYSVVWCSL